MPRDGHYAQAALPRAAEHAALATRPRVSVVTVVYFTGPVLFQHLESVLSDPDVDELIVVDNGSAPDDADRLQDIAVERRSRMTLLQGHGNVGFARGCNMGVEQAAGDWLLFLNPDAVLKRGAVRRLIEARLRRPEAPVIVGGRITNTDGTEQRGGRRGEVTPISTVLSLSRLTRLEQFRAYEIHHEDAPLPLEPVETPTVSGACFLMSQEDYRAVGGFDTGYFLHVEDVDLCWRVRKQGGVVLFHPQAEVIHHGHTSMTEPLFVEFWKGRGLARYFRKRADTPGARAAAVLLGPVIVGVSLLRAAAFKLKA
jgi:hypothetical protein